MSSGRKNDALPCPKMSISLFLGPGSITTLHGKRANILNILRWEIILGYLGGPNVSEGSSERKYGDRRVRARKGDVTMKAEVRVTQGQQPRSTSSLQKLKKAMRRRLQEERGPATPFENSGLQNWDIDLVLF